MRTFVINSSSINIKKNVQKNKSILVEHIITYKYNFTYYVAKYIFFIKKIYLFFIK